MKEDLEAVERFIAEELETRQTSLLPACGESSYIASAESALEALRRVRVREERTLEWTRNIVWALTQSDEYALRIARSDVPRLFAILNAPES